MHVAEVQLLFNKSTFGFSNSTRAFKFFSFTILDFQIHGFFISFRTTRVKSDNNVFSWISSDFFGHGVRLELCAKHFPFKASWSIAIICQKQCLLHTHVHGVIWKLEFHVFFAQFKRHGVCLSCNQKVEGSVIDEISDWSAERLNLLGAENYVETGFLTWRDYLGKRSWQLKFRVLVNHQTHINIVTQIVCHDKWFYWLRLNKHIFEVYALGTSRDLLKLFTCKFNRTVFYFSLGCGFKLELLFNDAIWV